MTLGFSIEINGKACHFPKKIAASFGEENGFQPKYHSIRKGKRWKEGLKIHFVTGNRTPERFQFREAICTRVQDIVVFWVKEVLTIEIDSHRLTSSQIETLAVNDGFENAAELEAFFASNMRAYEVFEGQIVHWTQGSYQNGWVDGESCISETGLIKDSGADDYPQFMSSSDEEKYSSY